MPSLQFARYPNPHTIVGPVCHLISTIHSQYGLAMGIRRYPVGETSRPFVMDVTALYIPGYIMQPSSVLCALDPQTKITLPSLKHVIIQTEDFRNIQDAASIALPYLAKWFSYHTGDFLLDVGYNTIEASANNLFQLQEYILQREK